MRRSRAEIEAGARALGDALRAARTALGLSQERAAEHFGVVPGTLQALEQYAVVEHRPTTLQPFDVMLGGASAYELFNPPPPPPVPMATKAEVDELRAEIRRQGDQLDLLVRLVAERIPQVSTAAELTEILELVQRLIAERTRPAVWQ